MQITNQKCARNVKSQTYGAASHRIAVAIAIRHPRLTHLRVSVDSLSTSHPWHLHLTLSLHSLGSHILSHAIMLENEPKMNISLGTWTPSILIVTGQLHHAIYSCQSAMMSYF